MGVKKVDVPDVVHHAAPGPAVVVIIVPLLNLVITGPTPGHLILLENINQKSSNLYISEILFWKDSMNAPADF